MGYCRCIGRVAAAVLLLGILAGGAVRAADDPLAVSNALWDANNAHAIDAALALFADDAVLQLAPPRSTRYVGKAGIRTWLEENTAGHHHSEVVGTPQVAGDKATFTIELASDVFRAASISPVPFVIEIVVSGGKIKSFTAFPTAETNAKLARLSSPSPAAPAVTNPAAVVQQFSTAYNAGDAAAAVALFADTIHFKRDFPPLELAGKAAFRAQVIEVSITGHIHTEPGPVQVAGNTVTGRARVTNDFLRGIGIVAEADSTFVVENGLIVSWEIRQTPETLAAIQRATTGAAPTTPSAPPRTGGGGEASFIHRLGDG